MSAHRGRYLSRVLDALLAFLGLILAMPVLICLVVLIRLDSKGAPILVQLRVGKNEKVFKCYKLRTMRRGTKIEATHLVSRDQITSIGGLLRKCKLDELPQLWNVLLGEMAIVGPRPCLPTQEELISTRRKMGVFSVTPGITGLAQVRGVDMSDVKRIAGIDKEYIDNWTLKFDLEICWATLRGKGFRDYAN